MWTVGLLCIGWSVLISSKAMEEENPEFDFTGPTDFPKDFIWATATASYQIEGAWNLSGKGENIWDNFTHSRPEMIANRDNGDIACDSYHKYKEDVQHIKYIGFGMYRFSLSWSRLFPTGYTSTLNQDGVRYYNALLDELLESGIEPMITIYHWDLPQPLQDIGGWLNPRIADIFADYCREVFKLFGNRVKWWVTINEPQSVSFGYGDQRMAPALNMHGVGEYESVHNMIRAHGKAYRVYDREFRAAQGGKVTLALNGDFSIPKDPNNPANVEAAERANQFANGWFYHPIYSESGDYPPVMREYIDRNSNLEGRNKSRLPSFTEEEKREIRGSMDYMGLNHYTTKAVETGVSSWYADPSWDRDRNVIVQALTGALESACNWLQVTPEGFRGYLNWMKKTYNNPEIFITETGYCDTDKVNDTERVHYYKEYLKNLLAGMKEDGLRVTGYAVWSLFDNFEWRDGFTKKFGIIRVDFNSPERTRTMKSSAKFFKKLIEENKQKK